NLFNAGEKWQQRRKLLTPAFHFNILRQFFVILEENSQRLVKALGETAGEDVDIVPVLSEFTLNSICETAMGTRLSEETTGAGKSYKEAIYRLVQLLLHRFIRVYLYPDLFFKMSAVGRKTKTHLTTIHNFTERVVRDRREYVNTHGIKTADIVDGDDDDVYKKRKKIAMLDLLLLAEKDGLIDNVGIQEEVDTFMFEDNIYRELKEIFGDSTRSATMEDLSKMHFLERCIKESLRLYPPVHFISRQLNEKITLSGYTIPSGVFCHINILHLHHSPNLYKDPLKFDPDRFLPENSVGRHPYAYIPFSAGPRNCIGQKFAMMEMKLAISEILRIFKLVPVTRTKDIDYLLILLVLLVLIHLAFNYNEKARLLRNIPGPKDTFIVGNALEIIVNPGEKWQQRRKLLTPAFHFNILRQFFVILEENSQRLVKALGETAGEDVDIVPVLSEFTLNSICETAMGTQLSEETTGTGRSYKEAIYGLGQLILHRFIRVYLYPDLFFYMSAVGRKMKNYLATIHSFTERVIRDRREYVNTHGIKTADIVDDDDDVYKKRKKTAMLDLLLLAEKDGLIDNVGIQEELDGAKQKGVHSTTDFELLMPLYSRHFSLQNKEEKCVKSLYDR
ncbi:Cytochrome P450 4M1, partial [Operophtera brumata]